MIYNGWDGRIPGIDYPADAEDYVWQPKRKTDLELIREAEERIGERVGPVLTIVAAQNIWTQHANAIYGISDTGDETSPSESNPVPIEDVYEKVETEEERRERLWKAVQVSSIT